MATASLWPHEVAALDAFAARHGKAWRRTLADSYWPNARIFEDETGDRSHGHALHGLRNRLGPAWLAGFNLAKAKAAPVCRVILYYETGPGLDRGRLERLAPATAPDFILSACRDLFEEARKLSAYRLEFEPGGLEADGFILGAVAKGARASMAPGSRAYDLSFEPVESV